MSHWSERSACASGSYDPEWWSPIGDNGNLDEWNQFAIQVCKLACPVRNECLEEAFRSGDRHAILGGTDAKERERMKRASARRTSRSGSA